jgi:hypothetical protein
MGKRQVVSYIITTLLVLSARRAVIAVRARVVILRTARFAYCGIVACQIVAAKHAPGAIAFGARA